MSENYLGIITENYDKYITLNGISHGKVKIYRDTGVSKNKWKISAETNAHVTKCKINESNGN